MSRPRHSNNITIDTLLTLRKVIDDLIETAVPWTTREYTTDTAIASYMFENEYPSRVITDTVVPPGRMVTFQFGVKYEVPDSTVFGLPETISETFGLNNEFHFKHLVINDEDAKYFDVEQVWVGLSGQFPFREKPYRIPGSRFVASDINFDGYASEGQLIKVDVVNNTDTPRRFRAKIIGRERIFP